MNMSRRLRLVALVGWMLWSVVLTGAQARDTAPMQTIAGLGSISFPTSTRSTAAQAAFLRGALLLHLFEYPDAAKAFREARQLDPGFAMAYWGEAMTYNHGIWNQLDADAGRAALDRLGPTPAARAAMAPTPREKASAKTSTSGSTTNTVRNSTASPVMIQRTNPGSVRASGAAARSEI